MKALRQLDKAYKSVFKASQPYIYHFRITKALDSHNVPHCIDTLRTIREAKAPRIFALSVNVQSGSAVLAKTLREALIQTANDVKAPLYTFAEDCALESGFYLLSAGHKIYANPYALLGDVSSVSRDIKIDKLVRKYVTVTLVKSGKHKNMGLALEETTPETADLKNRLAKVHHEDMIQGIFESRDMVFERKGLKAEQVRKEVLDGRTFNANEALDRGLIDGIMTFEEFKDTYYKDYKLIEHTIDKDEHLGYEQVGQSLSNWWQILSTNNERSESILESYSSEEIRDKTELAEDMLCLLRSEKFVGKLKEFVGSEMIGEVYATLQGRMSMSDIMEFLDQSEIGGKTLLGGKF